MGLSGSTPPRRNSNVRILKDHKTLLGMLLHASAGCHQALRVEGQVSACHNSSDPLSKQVPPHHFLIGHSFWNMSLVHNDFFPI